MSTITAVTLDRLIIESGATKSMGPVRNSPDSKLERRHSTLNSGVDKGINAPSSRLERGVSVPPSPKLEKGVGVNPNAEGLRRGYIPCDSKLYRRNCETTAAAVTDKTHHWTQITPALYTTPTSTPLPGSPSSFPPSPYIINHKRRGPRLMKSFSEDDVAICEKSTHENEKSAEKEIVTVARDGSFVSDGLVDYQRDGYIILTGSGETERKYGSCDISNGSTGKNSPTKCASFNFQQDGSVDDFFNPQESMSVQSNTESEGNGVAERYLKSTTPMAEFYDAWEELSTESGLQLPLKETENELSEIRLSLLMEIEKRKQAEATLSNVRNEWQRICEQLSPLGLTLPVDPTTFSEGENLADPSAEICQQVYIARYVSNLIGRGTARAEVEMDMEAQIKLKNFEIARLWDRLHYYETVNLEMSQRNQEAVETARRLRQKRKIRQRWVWGSIAAAISLGSAVIGWSYFHPGKGSSSFSESHSHEVNCKPK